MAVDLQAIVESIERARAHGVEVVLLLKATTCPRCGSDALTSPSQVVRDGETYGSLACRRCSCEFRLVIVPSAGLAAALVDAANQAPRPPTATADVAPPPPTAQPAAPILDEQQDDDGRAANVIDPEDIEDAAHVLQGWRVRLAIARSRKRNEEGIGLLDSDLDLLRAAVAAQKAALPKSGRPRFMMPAGRSAVASAAFPQRTASDQSSRG